MSTHPADTSRRYLKPPWFARVVGNRMAARFRPDVVWQLSVVGRQSGRTRRVPVAVLHHDGERYLIAARGQTDWSLNLAATGHGRLDHEGRTEDIEVTDVPVSARPPLIDAYLASYGRMPTVGASFRALPDPADHPTFRITRSTPRA
ncbi:MULTISPECIES: nitroreductase/quinone reductase family protein [unclassified Pseudofrankia]|uniref:nitroreductase/quinone reductase family protein n=1 Tax=unclassified Pseudofrankia TaxID=2994372 RepID=UPI0008DB2E47|nr:MULTISPECIES: nitroreductase/quinone reductase family protein [unclassified Pseudofrankia]MDT3440587.1 nitroreductase/quinone reductase family protein [Pseudofrankia sp. BMG5.37]OHV62152.1 deazaflavin-dependent nitroreductase [Pseudofrankia sp. BMG5.36]